MLDSHKVNEYAQFYLDLALEQAGLSPCSKMGFGAVAVNRFNGLVASTHHNKPRPETTWICEPDCIRKQIPSRTQSMIGACYHAEEWAIHRLLITHEELSNFDLFVAGKINGQANFRNEPVFSCIRCASQMLFYGIHGVWLYDGKEWLFQTSEEAYRSAYDYALGWRKIV